MGGNSSERERPFIKGAERGTLVASAALIVVPFMHFAISRFQGVSPEMLRQIYIENLLPASPVVLATGVVLGGIIGIINERRERIRKLREDSISGRCIGGK